MASSTTTRRSLAKAATREKVVAAARKAFAAGGYEAATIRDIAAIAGMSTGAVFNSFEGKAQLYREVYGHDPISAEIGRALYLAARQPGIATASDSLAALVAQVEGV